MPVSTEEKERIVSQYLRTNEGVERLATSMAKPVEIRVSYRTPWTWSHREVTEPFDGREVRATWRHRLPWMELLNGQRHTLLERMGDKGIGMLADGLSESWFAHLHAQPTAGGLERLSEVVGQTPALVMNAMTYADFRKHPELSRQMSFFGPRWAMTTGESAAWNDCPLMCYRKLEPGFVWAVPRGSLERSPIEVSVKVAENTRKDAPARGEIEGHVDFEFEARLTVAVEDVPVMRLSAPP